MNILERATSPIPTFFKILINIGLALAAAGAAILAAPISLPAAMVTFGGYLAVGRAELSAVSQVSVEDSSLSKKPEKVMANLLNETRPKQELFADFSRRGLWIGGLFIFVRYTNI